MITVLRAGQCRDDLAQQLEPGSEAAHFAVFSFRMGIASNGAEAVDGGNAESSREIAVAAAFVIIPPSAIWQESMRKRQP